MYKNESEMELLRLDLMIRGTKILTAVLRKKITDVEFSKAFAEINLRKEVYHAFERSGTTQKHFRNPN